MKNLIAKLKKRSGFFDKADPKPTGIPLNFKRPPTLAEQVARLVHSEHFKRQMEQSGFETIDEAEDFEVGDDYVPDSPHELVYDDDLGKEISKQEKRQLDQDRARFDVYVKNTLAERKRKAKEKKQSEEAPSEPKKPDPK